MSKLIAVSALVLSFLTLPASALAAPPPEGSDPVLTISPAPAVVTTTTVGNQSPAVEFVLHNESGEEATVEKVVLEGEDAAEFSFGGSNCANLQPGNQCSASVGFKPGSLGEKKTMLHVSFAGGRPEQSFEVSGTSVAPQLTFTPPSHDFGLQRVYETRNFYFQLTNSGAAAMQLNNVDIAGGSGSFWTNNNGNNSQCWNHPLQPGESCNVEVVFNPQDAVEYEAELRAIGNGYSFTAALSGEGGRAIIDVNPNPADFGAATVGSNGEVRTIVLTNSGNIPAGFFIGIVAGGDAGSFKLLSENCSGELQPGASCSAQVRFAPLSAGAKLARLAFFGDSDAGAQIMLSGEGVAAAAALVPTAFDFGAQAEGTKSEANYFVVRNDGGAPLGLAGVTIVGTDLDQFALSGDECTDAVLAPADECLIGVRFAPDSAGLKTAKLRVGGDGGPLVAPLSGEGVAALGFDEDEGDGAADSPSRKYRQRHRFRRGTGLTPRHARRARCHSFSPCRRVVDAKPLNAAR